MKRATKQMWASRLKCAGWVTVHYTGCVTLYVLGRVDESLGSDRQWWSLGVFVAACVAAGLGAVLWSDEQQ